MERIHSLALSILSEIGVEIRHEKALRILRDGGCDVSDCRVRIPEDLAAEIEKKTLGSRAELHYRRGDRSGERVDFGEEPFLGLKSLELRDLGVGNTGAFYVLDPGQKERRKATLEDVRRIACVSDALENVKVLSIPVQPQDYPRETRGFHALVETMRYSSKPVILRGVDCNVWYGLDMAWTAEYIVKIAQVLSGSREELRRRPHVTVPLEVISPLKYDPHAVEFVFRCMEEGVNAVTVSSTPVMGLTAPLSMPAAIAQSLAETLPGLYLFSLIDPDLRVAPGLDVIPCEMRTLSHVFGGPETTIVGLAETEFLREYYGLPLWGGRSFRTDAKIPGMQAAFEKGTTATLALLAGASGFGNAGVLDGALTFSLEQLVIDNELISLLSQITRGVDSSEEDYSLERFRRCVSKPNGFVTDNLTMERLRKTVYPTELFEKGNYENWLSDGAGSVREKTERKVCEILKECTPPSIDRDETEQIQEIVREADKRMVST
jgi:trimethylamine--corrinoid protein Co-methyltransferase